MIYFDHAASSPLTEEAYLTYAKSLKDYANPSSNHALGRKLAREVDKLKERALIALSLSPKDYDFIITSGATEANNLALKGLAHQYQNRGKKIISSSLEHPSVTNPLLALKEEGFEVFFLPSSPEGTVNLKDLESNIDNKTILISLIAVNNEVGSINDISSLSKMIHSFPKAIFHSDVTQGIGKNPLPYKDLDLFSFSAHKFGGPKGIGGLIAKKKLSFKPLLDGGGQENGFRSGTINYPAFKSMVIALEEAMKNLKDNQKKVEEINNYLRLKLLQNPEISINSPLNCSPYILNFSLKKKKASVLLEALSEEEIYVSSVSACSSKSEPISKNLLEMGKSEGDSRNSIRLSFGKESTLEEAKEFITRLDKILERIVDR